MVHEYAYFYEYIWKIVYSLIIFFVAYFFGHIICHRLFTQTQTDSLHIPMTVQYNTGWSKTDNHVLFWG